MLSKRITKLSVARHLATAVLLCLLLGIAWNSYAFFSTDLPKYDPLHPSISETKAPKQTIQSPEKIQSWNIFGSYQEELAQSYEELRESKTSISLLGTFFNQSGTRSSAIISLNNGEPTLLTPSSEISRNIFLKDITSQSIIIDNNGTTEKVSLSDFKSVAGINNKKPSVKTSEPQEKAEKSGPKSARDRALEKYGLEPVAQNSASGYRITKDAEEIIKNFNLNPGDIIVSVNGYPVGEDGSDTLAMKSFQESGSASVIINQGGNTTTIEYKK